MALNTGSQNPETCRLTVEQERIFRRLQELPSQSVQKGIAAVEQHEQPATLEQQIRAHVTSKVTLAELCRMTGIAKTTLHPWYSGKDGLNSQSLSKIAAAFEIVPLLQSDEDSDAILTLKSLNAKDELKAARQQIIELRRALRLARRTLDEVRAKTEWALEAQEMEAAQ